VAEATCGQPRAARVPACICLACPCQAPACAANVRASRGRAWVAALCARAPAVQRQLGGVAAAAAQRWGAAACAGPAGLAGGVAWGRLRVASVCQVHHSLNAGPRSGMRGTVARQPGVRAKGVAGWLTWHCGDATASSGSAGLTPMQGLYKAECSQVQDPKAG
jgi:hypothetical protein